MGLKWRNYNFKEIRNKNFVNRGAKIQNLSKKLAPLFPEIFLRGLRPQLTSTPNLIFKQYINKNHSIRNLKLIRLTSYIRIDRSPNNLSPTVILTLDRSKQNLLKFIFNFFLNKIP